MKKIICELDEPKFELFLIELNGYGFEILGREKDKIHFALYSESNNFEETKELVEEVFRDINGGKILSIEDIPEQDWEVIWKDNFKPVVIEPFIIIPEWEIYKDNKYIPIKIHIGKAFGTGLHPTTQIMLKLIPEFMKKGDTVLDVGTGTGILAIAAKKIGAEEVVAIDIEKDAIEECELNSWENEVKVKCIQASVERVKGKYDVVMANLQIEIFDKVFEHLIDRFRRTLLISGIYNKEKEKFLEIIDKYNLKIIKELSMEEKNKTGDYWYGFAIQHK